MYHLQGMLGIYQYVYIQNRPFWVLRRSVITECFITELSKFLVDYKVSLTETNKANWGKRIYVFASSTQAKIEITVDARKVSPVVPFHNPRQ